jgi:multiple sugar transport system permease protein
MPRIIQARYASNTAKTIIALFFIALFVFPVYVMLVSSIKPTADVFDLALLPERISLSGYAEVLELRFPRFFFNSTYMAGTVTIVALVLHAMAAYPLARIDFPGKKIVFTWMLSTLMIPFPVIVIPLFLLVKEIGWVNTYAGLIIPVIPHAYGIFLYRQYFATIPQDLEDQARIDGCTNFGIFYRIFAPLSKPITITLAVAFFITNWNRYFWPLVITLEEDLWVLQVAVASFISTQGTSWNAVLASGVVTVLPTMALFFTLQKQLVASIKTSGLK